MGRAGERPEHTAPPDVFYDDVEARKYTTSTRIIEIQEQLTERAMELLALPNDGQPKFLLDLGCGSGLSGETLTEQGHYWTGFDISASMLEVAKERESETRRFRLGCLILFNGFARSAGPAGGLKGR